MLAGARPQLGLPPTATGGLARLAILHAEKAGADIGPMLRQLGLSEEKIRAPAQRLSVRQQIAVLNIVARVLEDDALGVRFAHDIDLREIGILYYLVSSAQDLLSALDSLVRYSKVANEGIALELGRGDDLEVKLSYHGVSRRSDRHQIEFWVAIMLRLLRHATASQLRPVSVALAHPRTRSAELLEKYLQQRITWAAARDEVVLPYACKALPIVTSDPYLNRIIVEQCRDIMDRRGPPSGSTRHAVENAAAVLLRDGKATLPEVARGLSMSSRTLARRLAEEGLSFQRVLDDLRRDLAEVYLRESDVPISYLAWLLGFQGVAAFSKAFKKWTGQRPSQMRQLAGPRSGVCSHSQLCKRTARSNAGERA